MNEAQKNMKKYTNAVERRLDMPREVKARVMTDFISSIQARREAGQTDEAIFAELGTPKQAAAELNQQIKEYTYVKSPWRWPCLVAAVISGAVLLYGGLTQLLARLLTLSLNSSIGIIGGADGPTAIFVTSAHSPGSFWLQTGLPVLILVMGLMGYFRLRRCPRNDT